MNREEIFQLPFTYNQKTSGCFVKYNSKSMIFFLLTKFTVNEVWELSDAICDIYVAVDVTCSTASILNLVAISIDRYRAVAHPISYSARSSSTRAIITIFAVWLISCCVGAPIILGLNTSPGRESTLCILYNSTFIFWSSLTSFYAPCIIMIGLYWRIFSAIRSRTKKAIGSTGDQANQNQQQQQQQQPNNRHNNLQHNQQTFAVTEAANTNANTITLNINHDNDNMGSNLNKLIEQQQQQDNLNGTNSTNGSKEKQDNSSSYTIAQAPTTTTFPALIRDDTSSTKLTNSNNNNNNNHLMIENKRTNKKQTKNAVSLSAQLDRTTTSGRLFSDTTSYSDATFADLPSFVAPSRDPTTFQDDVAANFVQHETGNRLNSSFQANTIKSTTSPTNCSKKPVATIVSHDNQGDSDFLDESSANRQSICRPLAGEPSAQVQQESVINNTDNVSNQAPTIQVRLPQQHQTPLETAANSSRANQTNPNQSNSPSCPMFAFSKPLEDFEMSSLQRLLKALANQTSSSSTELAYNLNQTSTKAGSQKISNENQQSNGFKFAFERLQKKYHLSSSKEKCFQQQQQLKHSCCQSELLTSQILQFLPAKQTHISISQDVCKDFMDVCLLFMISKADSLKSASLSATTSPSNQGNLRKVYLQLNKYFCANKGDGDDSVVAKKDEQDLSCCSSDDDSLDANCIKLIKDRLNELNESAELLLNSKCKVNNNAPTNKTRIGRNENKTCCACCGRNRPNTQDTDFNEASNCLSSNFSICLCEPVVEKQAQLNRLTVISSNNKDSINSNVTQFLSASNQWSSTTICRFIIWSNKLEEREKQDDKSSVDEQNLLFEFSKIDANSGQKLCKDCRISCLLCSIVYSGIRNKNSDILVQNPKKITVRSVSANVTPNKSSVAALAAAKQQGSKQKSERELECIHLSRLLKEEHRSKLSICGQIEASSGGVGVGDGLLRKSYSDLSGSEQDISSRSSTNSYRHGGFNYTCESRSGSASSGSITGYDCSVSHINDSQRSSRNSWSRRSCCQALTNCATCERLMIASSQNYYNQQRQQADFDRNNISTSSLVCTTTTTNGNNVNMICTNSNGNLVEEPQQQQIDKTQIATIKNNGHKKGNHSNYIYNDYDDNDDSENAANDDDGDDDGDYEGNDKRKEISNEVGKDKRRSMTSRWFRGSNQSDTPICECSFVESDTSKSNRQMAERSQASSQLQLQIHQQQCKHHNQYQHRNDCSSRSHSINVSLVTTSITDHTSNNCTCLLSDSSNNNNKLASKFERIRGNSEDCQRHNRNCYQQQPKLSCQHAAGVLQTATEKIKRRSIRLGQLIRGKNTNQKQMPPFEQQQQQKQLSNFLVPNSHINSDESRFSTSNTATINAKSLGTTTTSSGQQTTSLRAGILTEEITHMNSPSYIEESTKFNKLQHLSIELAPNHSSKYLSDNLNELDTLKSNCLAIDSEAIAQPNDRDSGQFNNVEDKHCGFFASIIHFMHPLPKTKLQQANNSRYNSARSTPTLPKDINNANRQRTGSRKRREKNAAKRERKATKTLAIVLGVFLICWTPFFTCNIIDGICIQLNIDCRPGMMVYLATSWLGYINSCVNPIIYTIFNMEFRRAFKKILTTSPACFNG